MSSYLLNLMINTFMIYIDKVQNLDFFTTYFEYHCLGHAERDFIH